MASGNYDGEGGQTCVSSYTLSSRERNLNLKIRLVIGMWVISTQLVASKERKK